MKTVEIIFNKIQSINPTVNTISSLGNYVSNLDQQIADDMIRDIMNHISSDSLAAKIIGSTTRFSPKQLWVIAYELEKNAEYTAAAVEQYEVLNANSLAKQAASKAKLAANKENSQSVLDYVKSNGKLLKDYYSFLKSSSYKREYFSKKFTMASAAEFLNK